MKKRINRINRKEEMKERRTEQGRRKKEEGRKRKDMPTAGG